MGDLYVSEAFQECCFITVTATGLGSPGLVPTCIAIRISNNTRTALTVQEVGNGWYRVTDLAAAIGNAEAYGTEWAVAGANTIHGPFKIYKVGGGQLQDIFDRLGAPAGASLAADLLVIDNAVDGIVADIGVFPTANYATLAAYVEDIRARLIVILADVTGLAGAAMRGTDGAALVASGWDAGLATILDNFTALRIGYLDELDFDLQAAILAIPDAAAIEAECVDALESLDLDHLIKIAHPTGDPVADSLIDLIMNKDGGQTFNRATDSLEFLGEILADILVDTGTTLENRQDAINTRVQAITNTELFGSVMQEELQLGAAAADVNLPDVDLPNITGAIDRVYLHFKVRMIENLYDGVNKLDGAQSIRIKKAGGAWGVDDVAAITFVDDMIQLAALTREAGDVWGGKIDVSSEVDAFNETYNIRWEDGDVDQDFLNFNDIEMFLRVVWK